MSTFREAIKELPAFGRVITVIGLSGLGLVQVFIFLLEYTPEWLAGFMTLAAFVPVYITLEAADQHLNPPPPPPPRDQLGIEETEHDIDESR